MTAAFDVWPTPPPGLLAVVGILGATFGDFAPVSVRLPRQLPARFVKVTRIGGGQTNVASDRLRVLVECYAREFYHCEVMCNQARAAFRNAVGTTVTNTMDMAAGPEELRFFIRSYGNESGPVDRPHPDILDRDRWEFQADLAVKAN